jgi:hypothetical protein
MAAALPFLPGLLSMGGGLMGLFGGGNTAAKVQGPPMFNMPNMGQAAGDVMGGTGALGQYNLFGANIPGAQALTSQMMNDPNAMRLLGGANLASDLGMAGGLQNYGMGNLIQGTGLGQIDTGNQITGAGQNVMGWGSPLLGQGAGLFGLGGQTAGQANNLYNMGASLVPGAQSLMQMGFDPQNALYGRTLQQVQDQTRAAEAARGIGSSPFGAGLESDATKNFNIDWQNQLLNRAATGAAGAGGLMTEAGGLFGQGGNMANIGAGIIGQGGSLFNTAANIAGTGAGIAGEGQNIVNSGVGNIFTGGNMLSSAPGNILQAAGMPYGASQGVGQNNLGWLNALGQFGQNAANLPQQQIQNYLNYLQTGNQAAQAANQNYNLQLQQSMDVFNQNKAFGNMIGQGLGSMVGAGNMSGLFGGGGGGFNMGGMFGGGGQFGGAPMGGQFGGMPMGAGMPGGGMFGSGGGFSGLQAGGQGGMFNNAMLPGGTQMAGLYGTPNMASQGGMLMPNNPVPNVGFAQGVRGPTFQG